MKVIKVSLDKIEQNENSRCIYKKNDLSGLMVSLKQHGLLEPVGVRELKNNHGHYEAVFGNRRIEAARKLGWDTISAHIVDADTDIDRDILGLVENFKRSQTSVSEDGRMFSSLRYRGLTSKEIAARLDISEERVITGLDVFRAAPTEYRSKIVYGYTTNGRTKRSGGNIPTSTAMTILNIKRSHRLDNEKTKQLFKYASEKHPNPNNLAKIGTLLKQGFKLDSALDRIDNTQYISMCFTMEKSVITKLEKKYNKKITSIVHNYLAQNTEFKLERADQKPYLPLKRFRKWQEEENETKK